MFHLQKLTLYRLCTSSDAREVKSKFKDQHLPQFPFLVHPDHLHQGQHPVAHYPQVLQPVQLHRSQLHVAEKERLKAKFLQEINI